VLRTVDAHQRRVILDGALIREPQQCPAVIAQAHSSPLVSDDSAHIVTRCTQDERVRGQVLLHEGLLTAVNTDHGERPVLELREIRPATLSR